VWNNCFYEADKKYLWIRIPGSFDADSEYC
jgi:hypothetical protein